MNSEKTLRIFVGSPSDVQEERNKAKHILSVMQKRYLDQVRLLPVFWEDLALSSTSSLQEGINRIIAADDRIDIAVFIFWTQLGSPLGPTAERWGLAPATTGTECEFDLMFKGFEKSEGRHPFKILTYLRLDHEGYEKKFSKANRDGRGGEVVRQKERLDEFFHHRFNDEHNHNKAAFHQFTNLVHFAEMLDGNLEQVVQEILGTDVPRKRWENSPYRCLDVFDIQDSPIFFGREDEILDLLQRLRDQRASGCAFACIVGASGAGKSSLARAGVAARLLDRYFDDQVSEWRVSIFMPSFSPDDLFGGFTEVLSKAVPELESVIARTEFANRLEHNRQAAMDLLNTAMHRENEKLGGTLRILVVLDQMEEFWNIQPIADAQRESFFEAILSLARSGHITVLGTLRSDFYHLAQASTVFMDLKGKRGHFDLTMPGTAALHKLISKPAACAGVRFESDHETGTTLDQKILEDVTKDAASLPLLQYALSALYDCHDKESRCLTFADYLKIGRVEGALQKQLEDVCKALTGDERVALDEMFPLVVVVDENNPLLVSRRTALIANLNSTPTRKSLTDKLIKSRFLTTDRNKNSEAVVSLAHESLLKKWKQLTDWVEINRELLRIRGRIEQSQRRWKEKEEDPSLLLTKGVPLDDGKRLLLDGARLIAASDFVPIIEYINSSIKYSFAQSMKEGGKDLFKSSDSLVRDHEQVWKKVISESFHSTSTDVRKNVASIFVDREPKEFQEELIRLVLEDPQEAVRHSAARSLIEHGHTATFDRVKSSGVQSKDKVSPEASAAIAQIKAVSDMQVKRPPFEDWFARLDQTFALKVLWHSRWLRLKNSLGVFLLLYIPSSIFASIGAAGVKWLPAGFGYSCVQTNPSFVAGLYYGIPPGVILGGGTVLGLTLYRMVFGREYDAASLTRPRVSLLFGSISGLLMGILCILLIASIFQPKGLIEMGWAEDGWSKSTVINAIFFKNLCGWAFPLTSLGIGLSFALTTNALRGSKEWPEFLEKQEAISTWPQFKKMIKGLFGVTLSYSWPIWTIVPLMAVIALGVMAIGDNSRPKSTIPPPQPFSFLGAFDEPMPPQLQKDLNHLSDDEKPQLADYEKKQSARRTAWKMSTGGRALALFGDCLSKVVGGYTCIVGMGLGIVLCRHGLFIKPRDIHG